MAEAAGLALGVVALASLFQTCVEFLEYFEVARNLPEDGELVSTKLSLLETRLRSCGCELKVLDPRRQDGGWHGALADEEGVITRCLVGIRDILGDASKLRTKYGLDKRKRLGWTFCFPFRLQHPQQAKAGRFSSIISLRRHVVWAVRDKKRFDSLIQDLDFFITNLEKVGSHVASLDTKNDILVCESKDHRMNSRTERAGFESQGRQLGTGKLVENSGSPLDASDRPIDEAPVQGSKYTHQTAEDDARQNVGAVGNVTNRLNDFDGQTAKGRSSQQVGDCTERAAARFFETPKTPKTPNLPAKK
ncbi:prion-inhibition and propagation-domain-containing protein [Diaporthe sp. PMI_573]|nr:prion-inhibition and propagation-domain-containing protein [Diaporthaceae sp. PMI_573]